MSLFVKVKNLEVIRNDPPIVPLWVHRPEEPVEMFYTLFSLSWVSLAEIQTVVWTPAASSQPSFSI